jgi:putative ABC transport system permease protein
MLTGDRAKYFAILFGVAFAALLITEQSATFCGIMLRTISQIRDIYRADIWVMNSNVRYVDDLKAISDNDVFRVRGVPGVAWAVNLFQGQHDLAKANLALLKAGAWEPDIAIATANVEIARAQVEQTKTNLELQEIRAPPTAQFCKSTSVPGISSRRQEHSRCC